MTRDTDLSAGWREVYARLDCPTDNHAERDRWDA